MRNSRCGITIAIVPTSHQQVTQLCQGDEDFFSMCVEGKSIEKENEKAYRSVSDGRPLKAPDGTLNI